MMDAMELRQISVCGLDVGKGEHHATALDRDGHRLHDKALPQHEQALRALFDKLNAHGPVVVVVDQPASIGALPVAIARSMGVMVAYLPGLAMRRIADLHPGNAKTDARDAFIIADDADIPAAADAVAWSAMANSGQTCVGTERVYVDERVYQQFLAELQNKLQGIEPGSDERASYGPMTMPAQLDIVRSHIEDALAQGGRAVVGGPDSVRAPFIGPVVLVDTPESSRAVQEETFGPTVTVRSVAGIDEAVELANGTEFGLASTVFSRQHGMAIARRLRAGATSINAPLSFAAISALPFGGVGASGIGRIHGADGLREFTRTHSIARQRFVIPGMALLSFSRKSSTVAMIKQIVRLRHGRHA